MKLSLVLAASVLALAACTDTTGLSKESSRSPKGNANAVITVVEYGDLQCPACQAAHGIITLPVIQKYGSQIRFEFRHFPLRSIHRFAFEASLAAECAADQGKFWEFVDLLYSEQKKLTLEQLPVWAGVLGMDRDLFNRCLKSQIKRDTVLADYEEGKERGVKGTPTYFVNGEKVESGFDTISAAIDEVLKGMMRKL
jgi:protein-disulfide isomerase